MLRDSVEERCVISFEKLCIAGNGDGVLGYGEGPHTSQTKKKKKNKNQRENS